MMKRFLCILLCLLMAAPAALADSYTPTKLFQQQFITGGNGLRGTVSVTASGAAEWLEVLLPFTAAEMQVRIIGEQQGAESHLVTDDDDWQVKLWVKDAEGNQRGLTWLYGGPEAMYIRSELLPGELLTLPVKGAHPPYQLAKGEFLQLFTAFDPLGLMQAGEGGNAEAWSAMTGMSAISDAEWESSWQPVLDKYGVLMDMWLAEFAAPTVVSGGKGSMTLRTAYDIPAEEIKAQAKYIIGLMINDSDLQSLLIPYFTDEQRSLYLNPAMLWFYEHCIDIAPLNGSVQLEREMTAMGETTAMGISLPLPVMPEELMAPLGGLVADMFGLPYEDAFANLQRISVRQSGEELSVSLTSPQRTIAFVIEERVENAESLQLAGYLRITPAVGNEEPPMSAAFTFKSSQRIWEDEAYSSHEDFTWSLALTPDLTLMAADDPFGSLYVDFAPISLDASVACIRKEKAASPVQLVIDVKAMLPDAEIGVTANLKVAERWTHDALPIDGAKPLNALSDAQKDSLRTTLIQNAVELMTTLNQTPAEP